MNRRSPNILYLGDVVTTRPLSYFGGYRLVDVRITRLGRESVIVDRGSYTPARLTFLEAAGR